MEKLIIKFIGIVCFIVVLSLVTGMVNQPWWFRLIYNFPLVYLIVDKYNVTKD